MKYAIDAYEGLYEGSYGMNERFVIEVDSYDEAIKEAKRASYNVMEDYDCIMEELEEVIRDTVEEDFIDENEDYYFTVLKDVMEQNMAYNIFEIESDLSLEELNDMAFNDFEGLIKNYGTGN